MDAETCLFEKPNIDKVDMTGTTTLSQLTWVIPNEIMNEYVGSLPKDPINLTFISQYLNFANKYKSSARLEHLVIIFLDFDLDSNLQFLFLYLQTL